MRLPFNLLTSTYERPRIFLCEADKSIICQLNTRNTNGSFKFNSMSELSFEVSRIYNDSITGENKVNPFYDKIEALRLVYLEGFGYFEIQGPELIGDGIKEVKNITAQSLECTLAQKYLSEFYVNTGAVDSLEVLYANEKNNGNIIPVTLYNPSTPELSLLDLILEKIYGWTIGHVDDSLKTLSRQFEVSRESVYDFIINEICAKFNCFVVFNTIKNTINFYAEYPTAKFFGDGTTTIFTIKNANPTFSSVETVSIDGYKTTRWEYGVDAAGQGILALEEAPGKDVVVEVVGVDATWETDVFVSFDNLSQEVNVNYDADNIKTVLYVTYGEDNNNIREVNLGLPYLTDLSYYYSEEWMGEDLYNAYNTYQEKCEANRSDYIANAKKMLDIASHKDFEENRLSLGYGVASVSAETVGTYYVRGGSEPDYYYTEVSLPADYNANTTYYSMKTTNLNEDKVSKLFVALQKFFNRVEGWRTEFKNIAESFKFINDQFMALWGVLEKKDVFDKKYDPTTDNTVESAIYTFLGVMWEEIGRTPLKSLYQAPYKTVQTTNIDAGWSNKDNDNYGAYYPVVLLLKSIDDAIAKRDAIIGTYEDQYEAWQNKNIAISDQLSMDKNFTKGQLLRLSAFLREDELHLDDIVETSQDTAADSFKIKQDAMESGRIELKKLSQPQLQFSMSMANIYALPEFEPIVDKFQLGNIIKVEIRKGYIKQSRLLQVDINFDDFSDFSCEFSELTSLRNQSDIHADLLAKAISAGKSVATNSAYWTRGSDKATSTDLKIQQGLLDAVDSLKSMDGNQNVSLDKYGLHLEKIDAETGEKDPEQVWLVNNKIVFTDDNFKTSRMALGRVTVDGHDYYGIISEIMLAGYIEGSKIVGGTINIGNGNFVVNEDGTVTMNGGSTIKGYATEAGVQEIQKNLQNQLDGINNTKMYRVEVSTSGSLIISDSDQKTTLTCKIYSWDTDITETYKSKIRWKRVSSDTEKDKTWNNQSKCKGTTSIEIGANDVVHNANFYCEVIDLPST